VFNNKHTSFSVNLNVKLNPNSLISIKGEMCKWRHNLAHYAFIVCTSHTHAERGYVKFNQDNLDYEQGYLACNYHYGNLFWKDLWAHNILTRINYIILVLWSKCGLHRPNSRQQQDYEYVPRETKTKFNFISEFLIHSYCLGFFFYARLYQWHYVSKENHQLFL
jgi:hypothetical protein